MTKFGKKICRQLNRHVFKPLFRLLRDNWVNDSALAINLFNAEQLIDKLKALGLGVETQMVEKVTIDRE
jgi:hypothetical protein